MRIIRTAIMTAAAAAAIAVPAATVAGQVFGAAHDVSPTTSVVADNGGTTVDDTPWG